MRLTYKYENDEGYGSAALINLPPDPLVNKLPFIDNAWREQRNKLGQLEDIEEELGIDLVTLFKALKNGIYFIEEHPEYSEEYIKANGNIYVIAKHNVEYSLVYEHEDRILQIRWFEYHSIQTKRFYLKDYGKTWALTREELEK